MIQTHDEAGVRRLEMERPPSNALSEDLLRGLIEEVRKAQADSSVRCLVLGSALPKYFSSGLDLDELLGLPPERRSELFRSLVRAHRELAAFPRPTIAVIGGAALAGGWILAMACDFRWMSRETGRVALGEVRLGLSPTTAVIRRLCAIAKDQTLAKDLVLHGRTLKAEPALSGGFVDRLAAAGELREEALREARNLAKLPPKAYGAIKRGLNAASGLDADAPWESTLAEFEELFAGAEAQEGLAAMKEKRKPRWE
ncbi:MAG: enoyl-CoA hydratase-related protein [Elusimicrobiota bacterium]